MRNGDGAFRVPPLATRDFPYLKRLQNHHQGLGRAGLGMATPQDVDAKCHGGQNNIWGFLNGWFIDINGKKHMQFIEITILLDPYTPMLSINLDHLIKYIQLHTVAILLVARFIDKVDMSKFPGCAAQWHSTFCRGWQAQLRPILIEVRFLRRVQGAAKTVAFGNGECRNIETEENQEVPPAKKKTVVCPPSKTHDFSDTSPIVDRAHATATNLNSCCIHLRLTEFVEDALSVTLSPWEGIDMRNRA